MQRSHSQFESRCSQSITLLVSALLPFGWMIREATNVSRGAVCGYAVAAMPLLHVPFQDRFSVTRSIPTTRGRKSTVTSLPFSVGGQQEFSEPISEVPAQQ